MLDTQVEVKSDPLFAPNGSANNAANTRAKTKEPNRSESGKASLTVKIRELLPEVDSQEIRAALGMPEGEAKIREVAAAKFDSIPELSRMKHEAAAQGSLCDRLCASLASEERRDVAKLSCTEPTSSIYLARPGIWSDAAVILKLASLLFWCSLFALGFLAEFKNSMFLVMGAGFGYEEDALGAFCFIFPVIAGSFVGLKFLERSLSEGARRRFDAVLNTIEIPLMICVIISFAWVIGDMHEQVDLFAEETKWKPPFWVLYAAGMFQLAIMVTMTSRAMKQSVQAFFESRPVANPEYAELQERLVMNRSDQRMALQNKSENQALVDTLRSERELYLANCVQEYYRQSCVAKAAQASALAQAME